MKRLPRHLSWDDIYQEGVLGLIAARKSFIEGKNCSFKTWASIKVRSAVLTYIRDNQKEKSTGARDKKRERKKPAPAIIPKTLVSLEDVLSVGTKTPAGAVIGASQCEEVARCELAQIVQNAVALLPEKERLVITAYFFEEKLCEEIAPILDVSPSRITQIKRCALARLQQILEPLVAEEGS